jgi:murein DD-endopeptidase MepM/ murein hydrolase activator NlpD
MSRPRIDGLAIVSIAFLGFMFLMAMRDVGVINAASFTDASETAEPTPSSSSQGAQVPTDQVAIDPAPVSEAMDPDAFISIYEHYIVTQGPHGFEYGHMAIDLAAGNGATILSPINGVISQFFVDKYGNTVLMIDNDHYQVTLLHGLYHVKVGETVSLGQAIGSESNQGLTYDYLGRLCKGRDCGYHSHLNVFDKTIGANINPLELIGK